MKKYSLKFVNKGKAFTISNWTTEKHENALAEMLKNEKEKSSIELDKIFRFYVILQTLREIDPDVTIEIIVKEITHPDNVIELFNAVYLEGKKDIHFRKGKSSPLKK